MDKSNATLSTVFIEYVFLTSYIDVKEQQDAATADIPGAYLHADIEDFVLVQFERNMGKMLCKIDLKILRPYI